MMPITAILIIITIIIKKKKNYHYNLIIIFFVSIIIIPQVLIIVSPWIQLHRYAALSFRVKAKGLYSNIFANYICMCMCYHCWAHWWEFRSNLSGSQVRFPRHRGWTYTFTSWLDCIVFTKFVAPNSSNSISRIKSWTLIYELQNTLFIITR